MPRSFRFEHFTAAKTTPIRGVRLRDKKHLSEKRATESRHFDKAIHYGHPHAQTEELLHVRAMNAQLEALAGLSANAPIKPSATNRGQPIGALPMAEAPLETHERAPLDMLDEARRHLRSLQEGLEGATQATSRLLSLPLEAVRMAARRLRLVQG